ncbi:MAG: hypothetical protein ACI9E1_001798 [Cryomorphaceae bacterium]|jgi:hypothetical protein
MKNTLKFALVGALLAVAAPVASAADCYAVSKLAAKEITAKPKQVLAIVARQVGVNEACACEIVKAAIVVTEADKKLVAQIVEQAIEAAPKRVSLITACALAVAPDARAEVMKVSAKYSKGTGIVKPIAMFSPLDFIGLDANGNYSPIQIFLPQGGGQTTPGNPYSQP